MNRKQRRAAAKLGGARGGYSAATATTVNSATGDLLAAGIRHHNAGRLDEAERHYRQILSVDALHADSLHMLGLVAYQRGRLELAVEMINKALALNDGVTAFHCNLGVVLYDQGKLAASAVSFKRALALEPDCAEAHNNLGNTLRDQGKLTDGVASYKRALALKPDYADAHYNLGVALQNEGKLDDAVVSYERALALKPDYAEAHNNLGTVLKDQGKLAEAVARYQQAIAIKPNFVEAPTNLGNLLREQGKLEEAIVCYQHVLSLDPTNSFATHYIASIKGSHPEFASHAYIATYFDQFANTFDRKLEKLKYESPKILVGLIKDFYTSITDKWDVLDLGCGTGLVGSAIYAYTRQLVGVDLSAKMLAKARERNLYQRLESSDLLSMMKGEPISSYDVIVAADVFVYIGKLDEIMQEGARLLRPGGVFAFSVEAMASLSNDVRNANADDGEYILNPTGRYAHSSIYIQKLAHMHGFIISSLTCNKMRVESGKRVDGHYAIFKRSM